MALRDRCAIVEDAGRLLNVKPVICLSLTMEILAVSNFDLSFAESVIH